MKYNKKYVRSMEKRIKFTRRKKRTHLKREININR